MTESETRILHIGDAGDWVWTFMVIASWAVVGSSMYMRGLVDASSAPTKQLVEQMAANGPYWPPALFGVGMAVLAGGLITLWRYRDEH